MESAMEAVPANQEYWAGAGNQDGWNDGTNWSQAVWNGNAAFVRDGTDHGGQQRFHQAS